ncbi:helix-turn-helix domain-containing protein [Micromonospora sp. NPDC003197]
MPQDSSHSVSSARLHRVVVIVDENSNPFELGCATEVFGLRRPEVGRDLYDFRLCSPEPSTLMRDGFFTLTGVSGLAAAERADTLIVPNRPDTDVPRRPAVLDIPDESLAPTLAWAQDRLDAPLTVAALARRASVSPATLHRRFRAQLGTTPLAWLTRERLNLACRLIERGEARFEVVARRSGIGTAANLRALMRRETGLSPSQYRRRFGPGTVPTG